MGRIGCSRVEFAFVESIDKKDPWLRGCPLDGILWFSTGKFCYQNVNFLCGMHRLSKIEFQN